VGKAWYNFFVVTEERPDAPAKATPKQEAPVRAADLVPEANVETTFSSPVTDPSAFDDIYGAAQIGAAPHGYTVLKVAEMLQSEHIRTLPADVKRKSILVALDAAGVTVNEIVEDAVRRDRALDTYERVLQKNLDELRAQKQTENAQLEEEIARKLGELRGRVEQNNQAVSRELENLRTWQSKKQGEEQRIAEAVSYFVSENPITMAPSEDTGGANHVR
jgi:Asp-tRNA(Asn)/Glu-tRNA(Gln) amidotransferase A subunit family amidase